MSEIKIKPDQSDKEEDEENGKTEKPTEKEILEYFHEWFVNKIETMNSRDFKILAFKIIKIIFNLGLFTMGIYSQSIECFTSDIFIIAHYIHVYGLLLSYSTNSIHDFFIYYNTNYEQEAMYYLNFKYFEEEQQRSENYFNSIVTFLMIPNETLYFIINLITKYVSIFSIREILWKHNYHLINFTTEILKQLVYIYSIVIIILGIIYSKRNCSTISYFHIGCLILMLIKIAYSLFYYFHYQIVRPKGLKNFSAQFTRFIRSDEIKTMGCVYNENCTSKNLEHIVLCHDKLIIPEVKYDFFRNLFLSEKDSKYLKIGFYDPGSYEDALRLSFKDSTINEFKTTEIDWYPEKVYHFSRFVL